MPARDPALERRALVIDIARQVYPHLVAVHASRPPGDVTPRDVAADAKAYAQAFVAVVVEKR